MIIASKNLKNYIELQKDKSEFSKRLGISRQTLYNIENGSAISDTIKDKILDATGFDFESAFEMIKE